MKKLLISISLLAALCSCHHDDDPEDNRARRTVFVYMAAENNLARFADDDLSEMQTGSLKLTDDDNLVVYVDRAGSTTTPYLARVYKGELIDTLFMPEGLAADPTVLTRALRQAKTVYPAKSYGVVLWGHASGWLISENDSISVAASRAYGGSTGNNTSSGTGKYWMNIPQLAQAIQSAMGTDKLSFVFGDCCSFGCIEIAYELKDVADYVIGSPSEIPDMGAPYDLIVPKLFDVSDNLCRGIIDTYYNFCIEAYKIKSNIYYNRIPGDLEGYSVPLAAVKTSELDNLVQATSKILATIPDKVSSIGSLDLDGTVHYAQYASHKYSYDMNSVLSVNTSASDYQTWTSAFKKAVPYKRYSAKWMTEYNQLANEMNYFPVSDENCGCVSMFFPSVSYASTSPKWNKAIQKYQWINVIHWEQYGW